MTKLVLIPLAIAAIAGPAFADTPVAFTYEGHKIVATVAQQGSFQLIRGQDLTTGRDFRLYVKNGYVHGAVGGQQVSYAAPRVKLAAAGAD